MVNLVILLSRCLIIIWGEGYSFYYNISMLKLQLKQQKDSSIQGMQANCREKLVDRTHNTYLPSLTMVAANL